MQRLHKFKLFKLLCSPNNLSMTTQLQVVLSGTHFKAVRDPLWICKNETSHQCCKHCRLFLPRENSIRHPFAGPAPAVEEIENGEIENEESELERESGLLAETATWY